MPVSLLVLAFLATVYEAPASAVELRVGQEPGAVALNTATHQALVADAETPELRILDLSEPGIAAVIALDARSQHVALNPRTGRAIVTHERRDAVSLIDLESRRVIAVIPVGREPGGVAVDPALDIAVVANEKDDSVSFVDLASRGVISTIAVGEKPGHVAINERTHLAIVSNARDDSLSLIDLGARTVVGTIAVAEAPGALAVNPQTNRALVAHEKLNRVSVVDLTTGSTIALIAAGESPEALAVNSVTNRAVVADKKGDSLTLIDLAANTVIGTLTAGRNPVSVAIDTGTNTVIAANEKSGTVSLVDLDTATFGTPAPVGKDPHGVAIHPQRHLAVVANEKGDTVTVIDLRTGETVATVPVGDSPYGVAIDPQRDIASITLKKAGSAALLDLAGLQPLTTVEVGKDPRGIASQDGLAVVANHRDDTLSVIDLDTRAVTVVIPVGREPRAVAVEMPQRRIWVTLEKDDAVQVVDLDTASVVGTLPVGREPAGIALSASRRLAVVANEKDDSVSLIDLDTLSTVGTIPVGKAPQGVAIDDITGEAFVVNNHDNNVSVISLDERRVADVLPVGRHPEQVAVDGAGLVGVVSNEGSDDVTILALPDTIPPEITVDFPANGLLTNQPQLTITGAVSETATLTIDDQPATVAPDLSFTHTLTLPEGAHTITLVATDGAGNSTSAGLSVVLDTTPPAVPQVGLITISDAVDGQVTVTGAPGSVEAGARVILTNTRTGETVTVIAGADGGFTAQIAALSGDRITVASSDAAGNQGESGTAYVPEDGVTAHVTGRVYNGLTGASLAGAEVHVKGLTTVALTAPDGSFNLPVPGRGQWTLFFKHADYVTARRDVYTRSGADATADAVALQPWDSNIVTIGAAAGGTLVDSTGNVEVVFPPGALSQDTTVRARFLASRDTFPVPLPDNLVYLGAVQMGPEHRVFNVPVTVRVKNIYGLTPGTQVPFAFASHDEDDPNEGFYDPGIATVSADGQFVEFQVMHFSCAFLGGGPGSGGGGGGGGNGPGPGTDQGDETSQSEDRSKEDCIAGSSHVSLCQGRLRLVHELPPFNAFGADDAPQLVYDSSVADPRPLISTHVDMAGFYDAATPPDALRLRLTVEGERTELYADPSDQTLALHFPWDGRNGRGEAVPTGSYPYELEAVNLFTQADINGTIVGVEPFGDAVKIDGRVIVNSGADSAFGAGWGLREQERVHRQSDGTLLLTRGDGGATVYHPLLGALSGQPPVTSLATGMGDTNGVAAAPDGAWFVSSESAGSVYRVGADGTKTPYATGIPQAKGIAVAADGTVYVASPGTLTVYRIPAGGGAPEAWASLAGLPVDHLDDLAIGPEGDVYLLDGGFGSIWRISPAGDVSAFYNGYALGPGGSLIANGMSLAFGPDGMLYVSVNYNAFGVVSCGRSYITRFDRLGNPTYHYVGLNVPRGLTVDDQGNLFVADFDCDGDSYAIKMITPGGEELTGAEGIAGDVLAFGLAYDLVWAGGRLGLVRPVGDLLIVAPETALDNRSYTLFKPLQADFSEIRQDAQGNLTRVQRDGSEYRFDPDGYLLERRLPQGRFWQYEYDAQGRLTARSNAAGHRWQFLYGATGLSEIIDPAGRGVLLTVDGDNNLVRVEEPGGGVMSYTYDWAHRIVDKTGTRGFTTHYVYGPAGNLVEAHQANGEVRRFESGRLQHAVTPALAAASRYDAPLTLPVPADIEDSYTDGRGNVTRLATNRYGSGTRYLDALGNVEQVARNAHNQITRVTYPNGAYLEDFYDSNNLLIDQNHSEGMTTSYTYDDLFRPIQVQSSFAPNMELTYDAQYNITRLVMGNGSGVAADFTYNAFGEVLTRTVNGQVTAYDYDTDGRLIRVTDPLGNSTEYGYDSAGNRTLVRDALGRETRFEYDEAGRPTAVTDSDGGVTRFTYQSACATCGTGRSLLTALTDAAGHTTEFEYDELGQLVRETDPAGQVTTYTYDASRNLASRTDADGVTVNYDYDELNRVIRKYLPDDLVTYTYDAMGNLTSAADGDSRLDYGYDPADRIISAVSGGSASPSAALSQAYQQFTYNRASLTTTVTGATLTRGYTTDALLRTAHTEYGDGSGVLGAYQFSYDPAGRRAGLGYPDGASLLYGYDAADRLLSVGGTAFPGTLDYGYDAIGQRTSESRTVSTVPTLSVALDRQTVTDSTLLVTGQATGGFTAAILNGQAIPLDGAGRIQGTVSLALGFNTLDVSLTDALGQTVSRSATVERQEPGTGAAVTDVLDIAPNGDVYILEDTGTAAVIAAGSGTVSRPAWLATANDVAADTAGKVYTLQGTALWVHDAAGDTLVADLSSLTPSDMEVGPDDQVYVAAGSPLNYAIYRIDAQGTPTFLATLAVNTLALDSSAWGLVAGATGRAASGFYRLLSDGTLESFYTTGTFTTFAVDGAGRVCHDTLTSELTFAGFECRESDGSVAPLAISGDGGSGLEFDDAGALHCNTADNVIRLDGATEVAMVSAGGAPVQGTLTITAEAFNDSGTAAYAYDARSQLIGVTRDGAPAESYAYDAAGNRSSDHRAADYVYNELNQLISGNGVTYTYDADGKRTSRIDAAGTTTYTYDAENRLTRIDLPSGAYAEYAYDPFGRRIQKRVADAQGAETIRRYVYDGEDILLEVDGNDNLMTEFIHGPGIDEPLAMRRNGHTYTYHADALGSIIAITDENGTIVQQYKYDAYGNIIFMLDPSFEQPYTYTGREYDAESGLYFYRARYYDPEAGRFIARDPIGFLGKDPILYRYVLNDPINLIDPVGMEGYWEKAFHNFIDTNSSFSGKATRTATNSLAGFRVGSIMNEAVGGSVFSGLGIGSKIGVFFGRSIAIGSKVTLVWESGAVAGSMISALEVPGSEGSVREWWSNWFYANRTFWDSPGSWLYDFINSNGSCAQ